MSDREHSKAIYLHLPQAPVFDTSYMSSDVTKSSPINVFEVSNIGDVLDQVLQLVPVALFYYTHGQVHLTQ